MTTQSESENYENEVQIVPRKEFARLLKTMKNGSLKWSDLPGDPDHLAKVDAKRACKRATSSHSNVKKGTKKQKQAGHRKMASLSTEHEKKKLRTASEQKASVCSASEQEACSKLEKQKAKFEKLKACSKLENNEDETAFYMQISFDPKEITPENPTGATATMSAASLAKEMGLPTCKVSKDEINATIPQHQQWVTNLLRQKFKKFACLDPIETFVAKESDEPLKIRLKEGAKNPKPRRYRVPIHLLPQLKEFIKDMLQKNWIEPSSSAWTSPVLVIKKPGVNADGTPKNGWRFVLDLSATNSMIEPQQYHIPDLPEMYNKLQGSKFVSIIDLTSGYWLCPLDEKSRDYTSFTTPFGTFRYTVSPMGLLTSAAHFQRHIERKLRKHGLLWEPSVVNATQTQPNQAVESREPIANVDDRVTCEAKSQPEPEHRPSFSHTGCCSVFRMI
jgi:hypothetical protein